MTAVRFSDYPNSTRSEALLKLLIDRDKCPTQPKSVALGREWFGYVLAERGGWEFDSTETMCLGVPIVLNWRIANDEAVIILEEAK